MHPAPQRDDPIVVDECCVVTGRLVNGQVELRLDGARIEAAAPLDVKLARKLGRSLLALADQADRAAQTPGVN